jgi:hypothetical protein
LKILTESSPAVSCHEWPLNSIHFSLEISLYWKKGERMRKQYSI